MASVVRVNMLANLEALCNISANLVELVSIVAGLVLLIVGLRASRGLSACLGVALIKIGLIFPFLVNLAVAAARDAALFN